MVNLVRLVASISALIGVPILIVDISCQGGMAEHPIILVALFISILAAGANILYFDYFIQQDRVSAIKGALEKIAKGNFDLTEASPDGKGWPPNIWAAITQIAEARENDSRIARDFVAERRVSVEKKTAADAEAQRYVDAHNFFMNAFIEALQGLANGRLTYQLEKPFSPDYEKLRFCFNETVDRLGLALTDIMTHIESVKARTEELNRAADALASRTYQQAANLEETSAALKEIATTVQKTATGAQHASGVVSEASADAEKSAEIVKQAIDAMGRIEKSSQEIGKINGVIDEIAFQTNLLALNAGVEAARAGEAGKGLSVASEVRALAQRSAEAAREIKGLITSSTSHVHEGVQLVANTGNALERIMERVSEGTRVVAVIASDAKDQANSLAEASTAIAQMDQFTQQNATLVEEANSICRGLGGDIADMSKAVAPFEFPRAPVLAPSTSK